MRKSIMVWLVLLSIQLTVYPRTVFSSENQSVTTITDFKALDIREREVNTLLLRGKILLIGFSTQDTSEEMVEWQTRIGYETGIGLNGYEKIRILSVADVSSYMRILRPIVRSRLKGIYQKSNQRLFALFEEHKTRPPEDLKDRLYFIPDWSGEIVKSFGIEREMSQPHLFIVDPQGAMVGKFTKDTEENQRNILLLVKLLLERPL